MDPLCYYCSFLFPIQTTTTEVAINHHRTVGALIESAQSCQICYTIQKYWGLEYLRQRFPQLEGQGASELTLEFHLEKAAYHGAKLAWVPLRGCIYVEEEAFSKFFRITITTYSSASSADETLPWTKAPISFEEKCSAIKTWYDECAANHPECTYNAAPYQYPTRLIHVGDEETSPRLVQTGNHINKGLKYTTLSHCWGKIHPLSATTKNAERLLQGVPLDSLPKMFHEAVLITRGLGIQYIWIDTLCILQDSKEDWAREASNMRNIYFQSAITISALDARDCTSGCFVDVGPYSLDSTEIRPGIFQLSILPKGKERPILVRIQKGVVEDPERTSILRTRGWTLQEELLSHREVECTQSELRWKCRRIYMTETGHRFPANSYLQPSVLLGPQKVSLAESQHTWCRIMHDYSRREFTFESDTLSALVGIISHYGEKNGHHHVLACWQETMIDDLIWLREGEARRSESSLPTIPSWSWLTRANDVTFDHWNKASDDPGTEISEDHTKVIQASVDWSGEPMLSDIVSTSLVLEGPLQWMKLRVDPRAKDFNPPYFNVGDEEPDLIPSPIPWACAGQFDLEDDREDERFACLHIRSLRTITECGSGMLREIFLILVPERSNVFRRVGLAMLRSDQGRFVNATRETISII